MTPVSRKRHQVMVTRGTRATSDRKPCNMSFDSVFKDASILIASVSSTFHVMEVQYWDWISHLLFPSDSLELMRHLAWCQYHLEPLYLSFCCHDFISPLKNVIPFGYRSFIRIGLRRSVSVVDLFSEFRFFVGCCSLHSFHCHFKCKTLKYIHVNLIPPKLPVTFIPHWYWGTLQRHFNCLAIGKYASWKVP
jgi:hypothetical protein